MDHEDRVVILPPGVAQEGQAANMFINEEMKSDISMYSILPEPIYKSHNSTIHVAYFNPTMEIFALKFFSDKSEFTPSNPSSSSRPTHLSITANATNESSNLRLVQGTPACVQLFAKLQDQNVYSMHVYEGGDLLCHVSRMDAVTAQDIRGFLHELIAILERLHNEKRIAHQVIRPENIFVDDKGNLVLGDFGNAVTCPENFIPNRTAEWKITSNFSSSTGAQSYQLPEMRNHIAYNPFQADIFALAMTLYTLYSLSEMNLQEYQILCSNPKVFWQSAKKKSNNNEFSNKLQDEFVDLFTKMVHCDPSIRPSLEEIKAHPFYQIDSVASIGNRLIELNAVNSVFNANETTMNPERNSETYLTRSSDNSGSSIDEEFEKYEYSVQNLFSSKRSVKVHRNILRKLTDFRTNIPYQTLFKYLFINMEEFSIGVPALSDDCFELFCEQEIYTEIDVVETQKTAKNKKIEYSIQLKQDESKQETFVLFQLKEGNQMDFYKIQAKILSLIRKFK